MKQKTNFQLVNGVLNQLRADVIEAHGEKTDERIKIEMQKLTTAYSNLSDSSQKPIDYGPPETRFAYVYTYVATHADYVYQILRRTRKHLSDCIFANEKIVVSCLGGGPGSELVGLLQFLSEEEASIKTLTSYLCDREQAWADCWTEIGEEIPQVQHLHVNFQSLDVTDPTSWSRQKKFLSARFVLAELFHIRDSATR